MVEAAYTEYIARSSKRPAPMGEGHHRAIHTDTVLVLRGNDNQVIKTIVLELNPSSDSVQVNNLVVHSNAQCHGYGRVLMDCAEDVAHSRGYLALTLYANVKMVEDLGVWSIGFCETEKKYEDGFDRVYLSKGILPVLCFFRWRFCEVDGIKGIVGVSQDFDL